jgi:hypothetical protein
VQILLCLRLEGIDCYVVKLRLLGVSATMSNSKRLLLLLLLQALQLH